MRLIVTSFYSQTLGYLGEESDVDETFQKLRLEKQVSGIKAMKVQLQKLKYQFDGREIVAAVCRSQQIEVVSTVIENTRSCVLLTCHAL